MSQVAHWTGGENWLKLNAGQPAKREKGATGKDDQSPSPEKNKIRQHSVRKK
jgi:hypothetical protein